ncbi:MAG: hypothetical protein IJW77_06275, partial [Clostridia bacterium]|nr:hypothetical protein [Clostridia bacterium]
MILAENKRTHYKIICASDADRQTMHAAEELRTYLNRITDASFQLYMEGEPPLEIAPKHHLNGL